MITHGDGDARDGGAATFLDPAGGQVTGPDDRFESKPAPIPARIPPAAPRVACHALTSQQVHDRMGHSDKNIWQLPDLQASAETSAGPGRKRRHPLLAGTSWG